MNGRIVVPLVTAPMLLMIGFLTFTHAQGPATDLKPTFISPTPAGGRGTATRGTRLHDHTGSHS